MAAPSPPQGDALWLWLADAPVGLGEGGVYVPPLAAAALETALAHLGGGIDELPGAVDSGCGCNGGFGAGLKGGGRCATGGEAAVVELPAAAADTAMPRTALGTLAAVAAGEVPGGPNLAFPPLLPPLARWLVALRARGAHLNAAAPQTATLLGIVAAAPADYSEASTGRARLPLPPLCTVGGDAVDVAIEAATAATAVTRAATAARLADAAARVVAVLAHGRRLRRHYHRYSHRCRHRNCGARSLMRRFTSDVTGAANRKRGCVWSAPRDVHKKRPDHVQHDVLTMQYRKRSFMPGAGVMGARGKGRKRGRDKGSPTLERGMEPQQGCRTVRLSLGARWKWYGVRRPPVF